eukprot:jgi/Botrbrau1/3565/Bobra.0078s0022.1
MEKGILLLNASLAIVRDMSLVWKRFPKNQSSGGGIAQNFGLLFWCERARPANTVAKPEARCQDDPRTWTSTAQSFRVEKQRWLGAEYVRKSAQRNGQAGGRSVADVQTKEHFAGGRELIDL